MYDSVNWKAIPDSAERVALYDDGALYRTPQAAFDHFIALGAAIEHITVTGETLTAQWADVEWGDLDEYGADTWLARRRLAQHTGGLPPGLPEAGVYSSLSRLGAVVEVCGHVPLWSAHYTGVPHLCSEACRKDAPNLPADFPWELIVRTQYVNHGPNEENYDISLVRE